ncbi:MAG: acyl-CoA dehydrogenase family protein [Myxococcales bacterium]|nr:acyl-CoA dehydrogenase family protein [Myxococcota bacterium]MDW8280506.1 acyl-CoA dehydrogenase family protein [Myxococcales bacterium]
MPYRGVDYFALDDLLTEEERLVRATFRRFVDEEVLPHIGHHFRQGTFPMDLPRKLGALGALGSFLQGYGCPGLNAVAYGLMMQELERGDSGVRSFASVQGALVMYPIYAYGSDEQKDRWLPAMARGEVIGCFGLTEPDFGSNPGGMRTTAERHGSTFVLHGEKRWITSGGIADVALIWARTQPEGEVRGFLVERGTPGFSTRDIEGKFSLRASVTSELILQECVVPESAMLPGARGLRAPLSCLSQARFGICFGVLGAAMACYEEALSYCCERKQFSRPLAGHQLVQEKLVGMLEEITKGQLLAWRLGRLKEAGRLRPPQISLCKRNNVRIALQCARTARDLLGANGITDEYQAGRHMCNLESVFTYEGTDHIHTLVVGEDITGHSAFD